MIANKAVSQTNGYNAGTDNAAAGQDLLKTADSALSSISDYLQRIRELSVKSMNGIYGADELSSMQSEIDQLKQGIQETAKNTSYNSISLLDGSMADIQLATNPDGKGSSIKLYNSTLEELGIADYDVTGDFNLQDIDDAIASVSEARSSLGATDNSLSATIRSNQTAAFHSVSAQSSIQDADVSEEISELSKNRILDEYRMFTQKSQADQNNFIVKMFQ